MYKILVSKKFKWKAKNIFQHFDFEFLQENGNLTQILSMDF